MQKDIKVFFCKYNDPIYVKLTKLEIIVRLANDENVELVLTELKESRSLLFFFSALSIANAELATQIWPGRAFILMI